MRRFPAPWTIESIPGGYKVRDANGQSLAYVYGRGAKQVSEMAALTAAQPHTAKPKLLPIATNGTRTYGGDASTSGPLRTRRSHPTTQRSRRSPPQC
jgi:hypothetical protein